MGKITFLLFLIISIPNSYSQCTTTPTVNINANTETICEGEEVLFQSSISGGNEWAASYQWQVNNLDINGANTSNFTSSSFINNDEVRLKVNFTCSETVNESFSNTISIDVYNYPEVTKPQDIEACVGETIGAINFQVNNSSATYGWQNSNTSIGLAASGTGNIQPFIVNNTSNQIQTATITVTPTYNGCEGNSEVFEIKVFPQPAVNPVENITLCNAENVPQISFSGSTVNGTAYEWTNNNTAIGLPGSGSGPINPFTATNTTNSPITAVITVTPIANGCEGAPETFSILVNPTPTVNSVENIVICNGTDTEVITFSGSSVNGTTNKWTNDNPTIGLTGSGTGPINSFTASNATNNPITAEITVTPTANGCEGEPETFSILVNPTPVVNSVENVVICEGESVSAINFTTAFSNTRISWSNDNPATGLPTSGEGNIPAFTATNNTNESQISTITITPTANDCEGGVKTFSIEVKPKPEADLVEDQLYCNGLQTEEIPLTGVPPGVQFDISGGTAIGLNDKNNLTKIPSFTPVNNTDQPKTVIIEILPKANGCEGDIKTFEITVNPTPNVAISPSSQEICTGSETNISFSGSVQETTFSWTIAEISPSGSIQGATAGEGSQIQQTLLNETAGVATVTYSVTPTSHGCSGTPIPVKVSVNTTPDLQINIPECATSVDLTAPEITAGSTSGLSFNYWTDAEGTSVVGNPAEVGTGTYYIEGTTSSGCSVIKEITIDKIQPKLINSNAAPAFICSSTNFDYTPESDIEGTTFSWSRTAIAENAASDSSERNSANPNETLINTSGSAITATYVFTLTAPNGCSSTQEIEVVIEPEPKLIDNPIADKCNGESVSYTPQSNINNSTIRWRRNAVVGNPAASGTGSINETLYNDTGVEVGVTYFITIETPSGCITEDNISFSLLSGPKVTASASKIEICEGEAIDLFSEIEIAGSLEPVLFEENFNNGLANWSTTNNSTSGNPSAAAWTLRSNGYSPGYNVNIQSDDNSQFIMSNSDAQGRGGYTETILKYSNPINTVGYSTLELSFWQYYQHYSSLGEVQVSTNNQDWQTVYDINISSNNRDVVNLNGYVGQETLYIRFRYSANWGYWWALDNIILTGEAAQDQNITWASNTSTWTSTEQNPENISLTETTIFTVTYSDPDLECPGVETIEVIVKKPPQPKILADYCAYPNEPNKIKLYVEGNYDEYEWTSSGEVLGTGSSIDVISAQGYTLRVMDNGCEGSANIDISENLVVNGDFEQGNTGFRTQYGFRTDNPGVRNELYPEGLYAVDQNSNDYHTDFSDNGDHTSGTGNFMIVNGDPNLGNVVWETTGYLEVKPNTDYYFGAWTTNLVSRTEADKYARLRLVVLVPGNNGQDQISSESTLGDLTFQNVGEWLEFFNAQVWNSGNNTQVKIQIINENTIRDGNDFGIDDISFAEISAVEYDFNPSNDGPACQGGTIQLNANMEGGREPIIYSWTGPDNFTSSEENPVIENATVENSGVYELTVTDFYGCANPTKSTEVMVIPETITNAGEDFSICAETADIQLNGMISGSVTSGIWSGGLGTYNPDSSKLDAIYTPSESEIETGFVELILTSDSPDAPCEPVSDTLNITIHPSPVIEVAVSNNNCFNGSAGEATVTSLSGKAPFTYLWSDGQTTATATGLAQGTYLVTVTDENGCSAFSEITILEPEPLEIIATDFSALSCYESADGFASIELAGGFMPEETPEYLIQILNESGEAVAEIASATGIESLDTLNAGNYLFSVSTIYNCVTLTKAFTLTQPEEILIDAGEPQNLTTCGITTAQLSAEPVDPNLAMGKWEIVAGDGGTLNDPDLPNAVLKGLPNTTYSVQWTVTPLNGCPELSQIIEINFPGGCSKLDFDGDNDYVFMGDAYSLGNNFTLEAWVKPHSLNGIKTIFSKRDAANLNSGGYDLVIDNGKPSFNYNNQSITSSFKIDTDRWYHLAVIASSAEIKLYVDGVEIRAGAGGSPNTIASPFLVGAMYNASASAVPENHFHGWIEEMRIWKTSLSQEQLRFMMNQRIKNNNTAVKGEILPMNVPGNLTWNNLEGYYRLISAEVQDGFTADLAVNAIPGELRNIQTEQENSAPLPYILESNANGEWFNKATWTLPTVYMGRNINQRDVWDAPNSLSISPSEDINWNIVILRGDVKNSGTPNNKSDIQLLGLLSESGTLDMMGDNNFSGNSLEISHYLKLDGVIDLNGESQLIQYENSILAEESSGHIEKDQQGTLNSFNYNYWTVPVSLVGEANNSGFKISEVLKDGSNVSSPQNISFNEQYSYADGNYSGALRISEYWLYKFHGPADDYLSWEGIYANSLIKAGEGFSMKGTRGYVPIQDLQNYTFVGKPNNGLIQLSISIGENRLVGNPYPSAIDATEFLRDNLKDITGGRNSKNVFNGTLYFWDHFGKEDTHVLEEYIGGYAAMNLSGGVSGVSNDSRINSNGNGGSKIPAKYIPVGQGFFVNTVIDGNTNNNFAIQGGEVTFKNSQRIYVRENPGNSQFLQQEEITKQVSKAVFSEDLRPKIRLKYESAEGYHRQILATGDVLSSTNFDLGYDAPMIDKNIEDIYWIIEENPFVIQAIPNFYKDKVLPLGIRVNLQEEFTIRIDSLENWDQNIPVYLKDKQKDSIHDLKNSAYKTEAEPGEIKDRFEIIFYNELVPKPEKPVLESGLMEVEYYSETNNFMLKNPELSQVSRIMIFDIGGKLLQEFTEIPVQEFFEFKMNTYPAGVYIIKIIDDEGITDKKFIVEN
ncbi:PKD-like domain-containing protein [Gramella sp. AN32]|uniref:PKD-like domain-containing protein n=1 Tax=Christiangramia antarctica TaxID=2058158 RepID=A0ABW5XA22_9FLAO|nr:PKD-like domain-containing protein [Gramella sp. AN32]